jgi:hypothetical protein
MNKLYQGDYTFPSGRSEVFQTEKEFEDLFYKVITSTIGMNLTSIAFNRVPPLITAEYLIDNIDFELMIPTTIKVTGSYNPQQTKLGGAHIHYIIETNKVYFESELLKIKNHFQLGTSNIDIQHIIDNQFENAKIKIIGKGTETIFEDELARKICRKIQTPHIRSLLANPSNKSLIELHEIAMDCYKRYGGYIITFLLKLPILNFGYKNVTRLQSFENKKGQIPALRFRCGNNSCIVRFYEKNRNGKTSPPAVILSDSKSRIEIGKLSFDGKLTKRGVNHSSISLFMNNFNENKLYCEVALGNCLNPSCNHPLSDPESLVTGYGRKCAENLGIPYGF